MSGMKPDVDTQPARSGGDAHQGKIVVLVDGTCIFCNRLVSFILSRDRRGEFFFAHLQSEFAREAKRKHGYDTEDVDGVYALVDTGTPAERLLVDGAAGRAIWPRLYPLANLLKLVPLFLLDAYYRLFARYRFRIFGQYDQCRVPSAEDRSRFIE